MKIEKGDLITNLERRDQYLVVSTGLSGYISSSESYGVDLVRVLDLDTKVLYDLPRSYFGHPWQVIREEV